MASRRLWFAAQAAAALLGYSSESGAQSYCYDTKPIPGTVGYSLAAQAARTNAQLYGAVAHAEHLLRLSKSNGFFGGWSGHAIHRAVVVPTRERGAGGSCKLAQSDVDLYAYSYTLGTRYERVAVFASAGLTVSYPFPERPGSWARVLADPVLGWYGYVPLIANLAKGARAEIDGPKSTIVDYILGTEIDAWVARLRAGYVGSGGLYASVSRPDFCAFASTAFLQGFSELALLRAGCENLKTPAGLSSLFARKVQFQPLARLDDPAASEPSTASAFWTTHAQQLDILGILDLDASFALTPIRLLHNARLGIHTRQFNTMLTGGPLTRTRADFAASVGAVQMPDLYYYGVQGGYRLNAKAELIVTVPGGSEEGEGYRGNIRIGARFNEPEILAAFPYAVDSLALFMSIEGHH